MRKEWTKRERPVLNLEKNIWTKKEELTNDLFFCNIFQLTKVCFHYKLASISDTNVRCTVFKLRPPHIPPFFYRPTPETLYFINTDTHTNKNMTFELLKVCRPANRAWIELRVMYVRITVRHARWVIINQNYCI